MLPVHLCEGCVMLIGLYASPLDLAQQGSWGMEKSTQRLRNVKIPIPHESGTCI